MNIFTSFSKFFTSQFIIFTLGEIVNTISTSPFLTRRIPLNYRSRVLSVFSVCGTLVGCLAQLLVGIVYDNYGYTPAWIITIITLIIMIVLYQLIKKSDKKTYPDLYKNNIA